MLPAFLIVGAQRCGTTSMYRTLSQHPAVVKAVLHKGVHYFDMNYDRGLGWYQAHFPLPRASRGAPPGSPGQRRDLRVEPLLPVPPARGRADRRRPARRQAAGAGAGSGRSGPTRPTPTSRPGASRPSRSSGPSSSRPSRLAGEAERIDRPSPATSATATSIMPTRPAASTSSSSSGCAGLFGRDRIHVVDSGDFFTKPEAVYDAVLEFLGPAPRPGIPGLRAAQRATPLGAARAPAGRA